MSKSFKDIYNEDKVTVLKQDKAPIEEQALPQVEVTPEMPPVKEPKKELVEKEVFLEALKEHKEESERIVETLVKANRQSASTIKKLIESNNETNNKLLEAIASLTEKVAMLEGKLEEMKHLEIPTPIVNVQMPGKKTIKKVHRDPKGYISHIEESEVFEDDED